METIRKLFRIDRREICFIQAIIEAYDGVAIVSTQDAGLGIVEVAISPGCEKEVIWILNDLKTNGVLIEDIGEKIRDTK